MKTVKAICIYKDNRVYNFTAQLKDSNVTLIHYDLEDTKITPCYHDTFEDLYKDLLGVLKSNDMRCNYYEEFNKKWYDISFINLDNPTEVSRHGIGGNR